MKQTQNKSSYENKTDPLRGFGILSETDKIWDKGDEQSNF